MCEPVDEHDSRRAEFPASGHCCACNHWRVDVSLPCKCGRTHRKQKESPVNLQAEKPVWDLSELVKA